MKINQYTPEEVDYAFGGINMVSDSQRVPIAEALSILDTELVDKITEEVLFVSSNPTEWAFQLPLNTKLLQNKKSIIFLSEGLFKLKREKVIRIILHEVAHHILKHKNLFDFSYVNSPKQKNQEDEADKLVKKWSK